MIAFLDLIDEPEDKTRFAQLYNSYSSLLYSIAYQKVKNAETAEDCVQETYLYVAKNFDRIEEVNSDRTRNYLATIVRCIAIKKFNEQSKILAFESGEIPENISSGNNIEDDYINKFRVEQIRNAINSLDESLKMPLYLKTLYNMKSSDIGKLMGITDDAVRRRIYLARKKIKEIIEREEQKNE